MNPIPVAAGIFRKGDTILLARRRPNKSLGGFWEFPGGKVEEGERPQDALQRELWEEMQVSVQVGELIVEHVHQYDGFAIRLIAFYVTTQDEIKSSTDHDRVEWVDLKSWEEYPVSPADIPVLSALVEP